MRKIVSLILVTMLVGSAFSMHAAIQQHLGSESMMEKLRKSHFGKAIIQMLQLSTGVKADFGPLFSALDALKQSLLDKKETEINDFQGDTIQHENQVARLTHEIQTYGQEVQLFTEELEGLVTLGVALANDLDLQERRLEDSKGERDFEEGYLKDLQSRWDADKEEYNQAIHALDTGMQLLDESRGVSGSAFVQYVHEKKTHFKKVSKELTALTKKDIIGKESFFIGPVASLFLELSKGGEELDLVATTQARNLLRDLKQFLLDGLDELNGVYTMEQKIHQDVLDVLNREINSLSLLTIPQTTRDLHANTDAQGEKSDQLSLAKQNLNYSTSSLEQENFSYEQRVEINQLLLPQYDSEYAVAVQAESIIQTAAQNGQI